MQIIPEVYDEDLSVSWPPGNTSLVPTVQELVQWLCPLKPSFSDETPILMSFIHSQREFSLGAKSNPGGGGCLIGGKIGDH